MPGIFSAGLFTGRRFCLLSNLCFVCSLHLLSSLFLLSSLCLLSNLCLLSSLCLLSNLACSVDSACSAVPACCVFSFDGGVSQRMSASLLRTQSLINWRARFWSLSCNTSCPLPSNTCIIIEKIIVMSYLYMAFPQMERQIHTVIYAKQEVKFTHQISQNDNNYQFIRIVFIGLGEHGMCNNELRNSTHEFPQCSSSFDMCNII